MIIWMNGKKYWNDLDNIEIGSKQIFSGFFPDPSEIANYYVMNVNEGVDQAIREFVYQLNKSFAKRYPHIKNRYYCKFQSKKIGFVCEQVLRGCKANLLYMHDQSTNTCRLKNFEMRHTHYETTIKLIKEPNDPDNGYLEHWKQIQAQRQQRNIEKKAKNQKKLKEQDPQELEKSLKKQKDMKLAEKKIQMDMMKAKRRKERLKIIKKDNKNKPQTMQQWTLQLLNNTRFL